MSSRCEIILLQLTHPVECLQIVHKEVYGTQDHCCAHNAGREYGHVFHTAQCQHRTNDSAAHNSYVDLAILEGKGGKGVDTIIKWLTPLLLLLQYLRQTHCPAWWPHTLPSLRPRARRQQRH